ncbi:MAG: glycoside hydrolase family 3 C-terminal domain-containing protein [Sphingomonadaceae bacterium]|nr:glycoside hydrolase family 3 C-terminal domain-containing protein [Sphingomonadaceae bacterium]
MNDEQLNNQVAAILSEATIEEKVGMMSGKGFFKAYAEDGGIWGARPYRAGSGIERLDIEPLYFTDGPRGVARGSSTCFPCSMARGASFDVDLERRIGEVMGIEARAQGCSLSGAVCINLLRHPAWGRAQETYGEDPCHLGAMGTALGLGIQSHGVIATVKHFALNSMENARFTVDVRIDERTLHEIYLPHFKTCLDAGVASVMSAYNKVNGEYAGQNRHLLTDILRSEWGFAGFVHSDWIMGVYAPYGAAAGLDIENPEPLKWGDKLLTAVQNGSIEPQVIDNACRRILQTQLRFSNAELPLLSYTEELVACDAHRALALEAAEKSAVLLENNGTLPLKRGEVGKLAVLGRLAGMENTGDNGSSRVRAPYVVTALEGLREYLGGDAIVTGDEDDIDAAAIAAQCADAVVVVVGYTAELEGEFIPGDLALGQAGSEANLPPEVTEARKKAPPRPKSIGGDRVDLRLPAVQVALIGAAIASGKPTIVVIVAGSAVLVEEWRTGAAAILQTFYSGMEGGTALARLLFGEVAPSGKLPFTVARDAADYPFFDRDARTIEYGYWHGYAKFEAEGIEPRYPFGHGLSYTSFAYRALNVHRINGRLDISVAIRNDGSIAASEVVQAYVGFPGAIQPRARKSLKAFTRVTIQPGETVIARMSVCIDDLRYRDPSTHKWRLERGMHRVLVGGSLAGHHLEAQVRL